MRGMIVVAVGIGSGLLVTGCEAGVECGPGTIQRAGECVSEDGTGTRMVCGPQTHFDPNVQACLPDFPATVCDLETTVAVTGDDGVVECVGMAQCTGCTPFVCKQPDPGKLSICGRLIDTETGQPIGDGSSGQRCDPANPSAGGACALSIEFYDALQFAQNPMGTQPLGYDELLVNDCGYFAAHNVVAPSLNFVGIGTDDAGSGDDYVLTGAAMPSSPGLRIPDLNVYATRHSTDAMWTATADDPFSGNTFSQVGVYVPIFLHDGVPRAGVEVTSSGTSRPADDYYFGDTDSFTRSTVDPALTETGVNGAALLIDSALVNHSGTGGNLPAGCSWSESLADAIPGVVFVQERHSECN